MKIGNHLKIKKKAIYFLAGIVALFVMTILGIQYYNDYKYQQTYEFKLIEKGYTKEEATILLEKIKEEKILELLTSTYPEIDFKCSDNLIDDGILDSLTVAGIISLLSLEFDILIPYDDIKEDNFNNINAIAALVSRLTS